VKNISKFTSCKLLSILSFGLITLFLNEVTTVNISTAISNILDADNITLYYITTQEPEDFTKLNPLSPGYKSIEGRGYGNYEYQNITNLKAQQACKDGTIVIFVHGWEESERDVKERLDRVKLSLEQVGYTGSLVGFNWASDTVWLGAQFLAEANGPKLASLIYNIKKDCLDANIRVIAHSLGVRVVLSSLDSLHKNPVWNLNNFTIPSIHLMGAAVDDEEVSNRSEFITIDQTNWGSPKSDYGEAIAEEVVDFTNLFSSNDSMLKPNILPYLQIYPTFESDLALGQSGYQKHPDMKDMKNKNLSYNLSERNALPKNYNEINVANELIANCDADADDRPDKPFIDGQPISIGENHRGYLGYRFNETEILDDGAINLVVSSWENRPPININQNQSDSVCHDSLSLQDHFILQ
jgi:hypothetical protein